MKKREILLWVVLLLFGLISSGFAETLTTNVCTSSDKCSVDYKAGTKVTLNAIPKDDSYFVGWNSSVCYGTGVCSFTMPSNAVTVNAVFELKPVLYVFIYGLEGGKITSSPEGLVCTSVGYCTGSFLPDTTVILTAVAPTGKKFRWRGLNCGTSVCKTSMKQSRVVNILFY